MDISLFNWKTERKCYPSAVHCGTNLNLQIYSGDWLNQVSSCCCCNFKAEDADLFIV